jgi:hypothetical protein
MKITKECVNTALQNLFMRHYKMNTDEVIKILEDNKITNVGNITPYNNMEEEAMEISRQQSKKNKEERTHSEKMQEELEPITILCPMHEDYDDEKDNV